MYKILNNFPMDSSEPKAIAVLNIENKATIPFDPDNVDFQQYQKWLSEGNQPLPADEPNA
jgi:hypothetical protein